MSDTEQTEAAPTQPSELEVLKSRARLMNITFSNNISVEKLREKINAKLAEEPADEDAEEAEAADNDTAEDDDAPVAAELIDGQDEVVDAPIVAPVTVEPKPVSRKALLQQTRETLVAEQMKLVRCRITNLDPKKKELGGEIITVGNEFIGTVRKFVPYGEATEDGWHIPYCIFTQLEEQVTHHWAKEFAIEVLPQLTQAELNQMAAAQAAAGIVDRGLED
jgi:hypothetical protein